MYITLPEAKRHLIIDEFFNDDDQYIIDLIKVAEDAVAKRINRPLYACLTIDGTLEPSVRQLILIMIGQLYNHREATTPLNVKEVPLSFEYLSDLNKEYKNF